MWRMIGQWWPIGFLLVFFIIFYSQELPNNRPITRLDIWEALPLIYLYDLPPVQSEGQVASGWRFFPQRIPAIAVACLILAGSFSIGGLALTALRRISPQGWNFLPGEEFVLSGVLGLSLWSLIVLGLGLAGWLSQIVFVILLTGLVISYWFVVIQNGALRRWKSYWETVQFEGWQITLLVIMAPFLMAMLLGALLPETDFDVKEYHLLGPKEFYQQGAITILSHNVYTSFPFLTEMLSLSGMVVFGDWYGGALAGKAVLMMFGPLTGMLVYLIAQRSFGELAGWIGLLIYVTTPWTYRISIIAYAEGGLSCYLAATLLVCCLISADWTQRRYSKASFFLCGLLAGSAVSCKYPGMVLVVIPLGLWLAGGMIQTRNYSWRFIAIAALCYISGVVVTFGPWMLKNVVETGNPVYPLLYHVFGGTQWSEAMDVKWKNAHYPHSHELSSFLFFLKDLPFVNDWQSVLVYGFGFLSLPWVFLRRDVRWLWIYVGVLFLLWWGLTHRLDRFWVPMQPVVCVLAGASWGLSSAGLRRGYVVFLMAGLVFNLGYITSGQSGDNSYLFDLNGMKTATGWMTAPEVMSVNRLMDGQEGTVLCVGEAELFDARFQPIYNTVFDESIFEQWCAVDDGDVSNEDRSNEDGQTSLDETSLSNSMKAASEIREIFKTHEVRYVLVNWSEILRYRVSYGYTPFVVPDRFLWLVNEGVLEPALPNDRFYRAWESYSASEKQQIEEWGRDLIVEQEGIRFVITAQIFPVAQ